MRLRTPSVLLTLLLASGVGAAVAPATAADPDPMAGAPTVGACFDVTIKQGYEQTLSEAPVDCSQDHTLVTSEVGQLPAGVDVSDSDAAFDAIDCGPVASKLVGKDPLLLARTLYHNFAFLPTAAQQAAGARWFSCHIAVWDSAGLNDLPTGTLPKATKKPADSVARCVTAKHAEITCAEKHAYRVDATLFIRASGSDKAIAKAVTAKGGPACDRRVRGDFVFRGWRFNATKALVICARKTTR